jgi:hypothetical protein
MARRIPRNASAGPASARLLAARSTSARVMGPPSPVACHADAESADEEFGKRRIEHAFRSETLLQSDRRAEDTAVDPDILAEYDHIGVVLHRAGEGQIDGFH